MHNAEFVSSALQKTMFYHNAADRELCIAPRKWFTLVFVPLISMCSLSWLSLFHFFGIVYLSCLRYKSLSAFWHGVRYFWSLYRQTAAHMPVHLQPPAVAPPPPSIKNLNNPWIRTEYIKPNVVINSKRHARRLLSVISHPSQSNLQHLLRLPIL